MKRFSFLLILSALIGTQSCTERIDLELNDDGNRRIVVDGWFTNLEQEQEVRLTWTTSYFTPESAPAVTGATVVITGPDLNVTLNETAPGVYKTPVLAGVIGNTYNLSITYEDALYEASGYMRDVAPIDEIYVEYEEEDFQGDEDPLSYYVVYISTQELDGLGDDYMWLSYVNGESANDSLREVFFVTDQFYEGIYVQDADVVYLEAGDEANPGDVVLIEQYNIGRIGYEVLFGIQNETEWNGGLFDSPPSNVATNVSNGALGYWGVAGVSVAEVVIPD